MNKKMLLAASAVLLFIGIMFYVDFLSENNYIKLVEKFTSAEKFLTPTPESYKPRDTYYSRSSTYSTNDLDLGKTQTINMPINTTTDCQNKCQPATARCTITGQQCATDYDCPGCYPKIAGKSTYTPPVPAANDAGKLTTGVSLNYSPLTFGYGTKNQTIVPPKQNVNQDLYALDNKAVPQADFGVNTWQQQFLQENEYYKKRYSLPSALMYRPLETTTGQFVTDDPLPANF